MLMAMCMRVRQHVGAARQRAGAAMYYRVREPLLVFLFVFMHMEPIGTDGSSIMCRGLKSQQFHRHTSS